MAKIAREAGISKALLYHYFPSKEAYFLATLEEKAAELAERTQPDPELPPFEQLSGSLDAYLRWVDENASSFDKMIRSSGVPEVRALLDRVRGETAARIVDGLRGGQARLTAAAYGGARLARVHGRRVPGLDRASRPGPRDAPRPGAGHAARGDPRHRRGHYGELTSFSSTTKTSASSGPIGP